MVVTITRDGFIKRTSLDTFRAQNRGGRGRTGAGDRGDDVVTRSFNAHTHQWVLFFSVRRQGLPREGLAAAGGEPDGEGPGAASTCCRSCGGDAITTVLPLPQDESLWESLHLVFATASGNVRRNSCPTSAMSAPPA